MEGLHTKVRRYFKVCRTPYSMILFAVERLISSTIIVWGMSIRARDLKRFNNLVKTAASLLESTLERQEMMQRRILHKIENIVNNSDHHLHYTYTTDCLESRAVAIDSFCNSIFFLAL